MSETITGSAPEGQMRGLDPAVAQQNYIKEHPNAEVDRGRAEFIAHETDGLETAARGKREEAEEFLGYSKGWDERSRNRRFEGVGEIIGGAQELRERADREAEQLGELYDKMQATKG